MPTKNIITDKIENIFVFLRPEYLKIFISLYVKRVLKNNCVDIKKINGNISKTNIGVFINDKQSGKKAFTLVCLKNSNSVSKLSTYIKQKKTKNTFKKDNK